MLREIGRALDAVIVLRSAATRSRIERMLPAERGPQRRHAGGDRAAGSQIYHERDGAARRALPRDAASSSPSHADGVDRRGLGRDPATRSRRLRRGVIIRKSPREIEPMARAGRVVADTLALIGERSAPASRRSSSTAIAEEHIRSPGRRPDLQGLQGLSRRDLRLAERHGRPRHPGRLRARGGRHPLDRHRRHARRLRRRLGVRRSPSARSRPEAQRLLEVCQAALDAGIEQARVGNHLGDISQAVQPVTEEAGFSVVRSLVGHGVGRSITRIRRSRTSSRPAAARSSREG